MWGSVGFYAVGSLFVCLVKPNKFTTMKTNLLEARAISMISGLRLGLEDLEDGKKRREKEYIWYGRLTNPEVLQKAARVETQKQSSLKGKGGTIRVRETTGMGQVRYTLTGKAYSGRVMQMKLLHRPPRICTKSSRRSLASRWIRSATLSRLKALT